MCCFTDEVDDMQNTKIFVALIAPRIQFTAYANTVSLKENNFMQRIPYGNRPTMFNSRNIYNPIHNHGNIIQNNNVWWDDHVTYTPFANTSVYESSATPVAMVLAVPLPTGTADDIKMVNMSNNTDFFDKLEKTIPTARSFSESQAFSNSSYSLYDSLAVKRCGPYRYSVVPDVQSFSRLRQDVFKMNERIIPILQSHYPKKYAFLVCIIDKSAEFSPIAYVHPSDGRRLFVPTLHEHGHPGEEQFTDDWDHLIYSIDRDTSTKLTNNLELNAEITKAYKAPDIQKFPYRHLDWSLLKQRKVTGYNPNGDILLKA